MRHLRKGKAALKARRMSAYKRRQEDVRRRQSLPNDPKLRAALAELAVLEAHLGIRS